MIYFSVPELILLELQKPASVSSQLLDDGRSRRIWSHSLYSQGDINLVKNMLLDGRLSNVPIDLVMPLINREMGKMRYGVGGDPVRYKHLMDLVPPITYMISCVL